MVQFMRRGGMIQFVLDQNRVRFEVNLQVVQSAHPSLSSQLLMAANMLRREP